MIFQPRFVRLIFKGRKTQTRRPVKEGETHCRYKKGRTYAVQRGKGKAAVAKIKILSVEMERLGDICYKDARREGFKTRDEFKESWKDIYGEYDADQEVWAISFALEADEVLLLAADSSHGYTDEPRYALEGEPEAVPPDEVANFTKSVEAKKRFQVQRSDEMQAREIRSASLALEKKLVEAHRSGKNVKGTIETIKAEIAALERSSNSGEA